MKSKDCNRRTYINTVGGYSSNVVLPLSLYTPLSIADRRHVVISSCRWSRREEQDFARVVSFFGVVYNRTRQVYVWDRFRQLANLGKKSDDRLTTYYLDFRDMCQRVINGQKLRKGATTFGLK